MRAADCAWIDGRVRLRSERGLPVDDSAYAEGRGCYSTVRIAGGRPLHADRHLRRLERGARGLALGTVPGDDVRHALRDLACQVFPGGEGIVRVQLSRKQEGGVRVTGVPRELGNDPPRWRAIRAPIAHEGPIVAGGHKLTNRLVQALAGDAARAAGADEALLFDRDERLVEGTRSNVIAVTEDGALVTPPLARGGVSGVGREILSERVPELRERDLGYDDLRRARAVACSNAVRGVRPLGELDGEALRGLDDERLAELSHWIVSDGASRERG